MSHEITTIEASMPQAVNPLDIAPQEFRGALQRRGENRKALMEWIRNSLVDGVDYGVIQTKRGPSKPCLRKPGAEKICGMLNVTATFPTLTDYERAALTGQEVRQIVIRCHLMVNGQIVADGVGARSLEQDYGDYNKALKMALKSAHIDATLRMAGLSEVFTQDLEDMPKERIEHGDSAATAGYSAPQRPRDPVKDYVTTERFATERQTKLLAVKLDQAGISEKEFLQKFEIDAIEKLPFAKVNPALHWIAGIGAA